LQRRQFDGDQIRVGGHDRVPSACLRVVRHIVAGVCVGQADFVEYHTAAFASNREAGVAAETDGLAAQARPGLAQAALAVARVLDNPKAVNQHAAAARVLSALLDKLRSASAQGRRGRLAVVRTLTEKGGA
jgi:hypothetical protein